MKLTAKVMEEGLKHGWTVLEFCDSLNIDSEEQLLSSIEKTFSAKAASSYIRKLKKNEKKPIMIKKGANKTTFIINPAPEKYQEPVVEDKKEPSKEDSLNNLESDLKKINKQIIAFETSRKDLLSENSTLKSQISKKLSELKELRSKIQAVIDTTTNIQNKISQNQKKISELNEKINSMESEKDAMEEKIRDLQKVTILLNEDGTIEPELDIPDVWENIYQNLFSGDFGYNDLIDQLTRAQIKQIAKIIAYVKKTEYPYEYITDNVIVEQLLKSFLS